MNTGRRIELDIAKGIGIILVVWAHTHGPLTDYIEQFHMPLFFFISGMLYTSVDVPCNDYILHKCKSLLIPFWWWNILLYPIFFLFFNWKNWSTDIFVKEILSILLTVNKVPFLGATWFLPALFWVSIIAHCIIRCTKDFVFYDAVLLVFGLCICVLGFYVTFPYRISRTLICAFFYICGYLYRKYLEDMIDNRIVNIAAVIWGFLFVIIAYYNSVSLDSNEYEYRIAFVIGALGAIIFVLRMSVWLSKCTMISVISKHITYIGQNSLCIVIWHLLMFRVIIIMQIFFENANLRAIVAFPVYDASGIWWMLYLAAGIYVSLGWQYILEHNLMSLFMKKVHMI